MPRRAEPRRPKSAAPKSVAEAAAPSEAAPNADEECFFAMARAWDGELAPAADDPDAADRGGAGGGGAGAGAGGAARGSMVDGAENGITHVELLAMYRLLVEDLKDKAWGLAVEALYLPHIERCSTLMTQYEAFRHPAKTAVYFFAGAQIEFVKKLIATSKREWKKHRHPREIILTLLLENAPPEYLERFLTMYEQIQSWWNANAQLSILDMLSILICVMKWRRDSLSGWTTLAPIVHASQQQPHC